MSGYDETTLLVRAIERMTPDELARFEADRDGYDTRDVRYRHCRLCEQSGYDGAYPFSTYGGNICDDCGG